MKKTSLLLAMLVIFSSVACAAELEAEGTMWRKLQRGGLNVGLSWMEFPHYWVQEKDKDTLPPGWMLGSVKGLIGTFGRIVTGVYEIVTFPIPLPADYRPILSPEFPYQHFD